MTKILTTKSKIYHEPVKGGRIARSAKTGKFVSVTSPNGLSKKSNKTEATIKSISSRRSAALERLANR